MLFPRGHFALSCARVFFRCAQFRLVSLHAALARFFSVLSFTTSSSLLFFCGVSFYALLGEGFSRALFRTGVLRGLIPRSFSRAISDWSLSRALNRWGVFPCDISLGFFSFVRSFAKAFSVRSFAWFFTCPFSPGGFLVMPTFPWSPSVLSFARSFSVLPVTGSPSRLSFRALIRRGFFSELFSTCYYCIFLHRGFLCATCRRRFFRDICPSIFSNGFFAGTFPVLCLAGKF